MKFINAREYFDEKMKDPEFRREYEKLEPEFALASALIEQRIKGGLTQAKLAKKMGTKQSAISRFESGRTRPTMEFYTKLAAALGMRIKVVKA